MEFMIKKAVKRINTNDNALILQGGNGKEYISIGSLKWEATEEKLNSCIDADYTNVNLSKMINNFQEKICKNLSMEVINIAGVKIILTGAIEKLNGEIIEQLKKKDEPIFWSDTTCKHWLFDFKINDLWFESTNINNELTEITLNVFQ